MTRSAIMHVIDTLDAGGAERMAVNLVNALSRDRFTPFLCSTRASGPLEPLVSAHVGRLALTRRHRLDVRAVARAVGFVRANGIGLLHAHTSSVFFARLVGTAAGVPVIWHDHWGAQQYQQRPRWLYHLLTRGIGGVVAVSDDLAAFARSVGVPSARVW